MLLRRLTPQREAINPWGHVVVMVRLTVMGRTVGGARLAGWLRARPAVVIAPHTTMRMPSHARRAASAMLYSSSRADSRRSTVAALITCSPLVNRSAGARTRAVAMAPDLLRGQGAR